MFYNSARGKVESFPEPGRIGLGVGFVNGRVVVCGGYNRTELNSITATCYDYHPDDGWVQIGNYPKAL